MAERQLPKLHTRVRFPSPAPLRAGAENLGGVATAWMQKGYRSLQSSGRIDRRNAGSRVTSPFLFAAYLFPFQEKGIEMRPQVVQAQSVELREQVFRLRYDVVVAEMGKPLPADHARRSCTDAPDDTAVILAAVEQDAKRVVGTIRGNWLRDGGLEWYERLYGLAELSDAARRQTSVTSRMMVAAQYRGSLLALDLAIKLYVIGLAHDTAFNYIDCDDHMIPFFLRLGYVPVKSVDNPCYGIVTVMRLCMQDERQLRAVKSPLLRHLLVFQRGAPGDIGLPPAARSPDAARPLD
jgi:hypothetical protein